MTSDPSRDLIEQLVTGLQPVRPIAPIGRTLGWLLAVSGLVAVVAVGVYGLPAHRVASLRSLAFSGVLLGLALAVVGACTTALASVVPGREALERGAAGVGLLGLALAVAVAGGGTVWGGAGPATSLQQNLVCLWHGALFAGLPVAAALVAAARGWAGRPGLTVVAALLGGGAAGALIVHLICPATSAFHVLCAHTATPILLVAGLGVWLAPAMRRWAR